MQIGPAASYDAPTAHPGSQVIPHYRGLVAKIIGVIQIIIGVAVINCCARVVGADPTNGVNGILTGILFIVTGAMGTTASKKKTQCMIITTIVMNVVSAGMAGNMISPSIEWAIAGGEGEYEEAENIGAMVMGSILAVCGVIMAILSIVLSGFGCGALCCKCCCGSSGADGARSATPPPAYTGAQGAGQEKYASP